MHTQLCEQKDRSFGYQRLSHYRLLALYESQMIIQPLQTFFGPIQVTGLQEHLQRLRGSLSSILDSEGPAKLHGSSHARILEERTTDEETMWHFISPTMEVAAGAAKEKNPNSHLWMIVIHLTTMQASQGANELLFYGLMPYIPDVMSIAACHMRARSKFL